MREQVEALEVQLLDGRCVLVAGGGFALATGGPTWQAVLKALARRMKLPPELVELPAESSRQSLEALSDLISAEAPQEVIEREIKRRAERRRENPAWIDALGQVPFTGIVSMNWDDTVERSLYNRNPVVITAIAESEQGLEKSERDVQVLKPLGDLGRPGSVMLSFSDYRRRATEGSFDSLLSDALSANAVLFVGMRLSAIDELLKLVNLKASTTDLPRYAVVGDSPDNAVYARLLFSRYGVITVTSGRAWQLDIHNLAVDLTRIASKFGASSSRAPSGRLRRIELVNIGPFDRLAIELDDEWTAILGDNGSGKSTILRAVALGIAGTDAENHEAAGLLKAGSSHGEITLQIGRTRYTTRIQQDRQGVRVKAERPTPAQTGALSVIGFPALRGVSLATVNGPEEIGGTSGMLADTDALRRGASDTRIDELQQWLVNLAVAAEGGDIFGSGDRATRDLQLTFAMWQRMTPGIKLRYAGLDHRTWDVLVETDSGVHPLRLLSQGVLSTIAWVGTLLRNIVESKEGQVLLSDSSDGARYDASGTLLLIDEIDAHLHPAWQRRVIPMLQELFTGLQVVLTTHSPLVVGSLSEGNVIALRRQGDGEVIAIAPGESLVGMRADQILTSDAFDLPSSRDYETARLLSEYESALSRPVSPQTKLVVRELEERLSSRMSGVGETKSLRQASVSRDQQLARELSGLSDNRKRELLAQVQRYFRNIDHGDS